jgi:hypothetical protein
VRLRAACGSDIDICIGDSSSTRAVESVRCCSGSEEIMSMRHAGVVHSLCLFFGRASATPAGLESSFVASLYATLWHKAMGLMWLMW